MAKAEYNFYRLEVWKLGMRLVSEIYKLVKRFPDDEKFTLTAQMRRAAISIPLNIAEGSSRRTKKDFASFVRIALGSTMEVVTCIEIAHMQRYIDKSTYENILELIQELYFKLISLDKYLRKQN